MDSDQIGKVGIGVIVALIVVGVVLSFVITALVWRLIILAVVVVVGIFVWQQRSSIQDHVKKCDLNMSFFGIDVHAPSDVVARCKQVQGG